MAHAGTEWTPREPEGDEVVEPREEPEPVSTWGSRRKVVPEPLPLKAGRTDLEDPDADLDDEEQPAKAPKPKAPEATPPSKSKAEPATEPKSSPGGLGDTDDIDNDPFFDDDPGE
ncbi:MAG: hypothetical protein H6718_29275 [Polyangiaceae bacterium]|nr:hypothetical protein [Myxococcales bacterium]MCB9589542.1 hypothetical protein [Polyangiaceae bacterium]MCB9609170.1 hypothetical protein [Polyangiaceae bacterium]